MILADIRSSPSRVVLMADVTDWLESVGTVLVVLGIPAGLRAWWKRRAEKHAREAEAEAKRHAHEAELRDAIAEVVCVLADAHKTEMGQEFGRYFTENEYHDRRIILRERLLKARKRLWAAMGFPETTDEESKERIAMLRALRWTQRLSAGKVEEAERIQDLLRK